jgi:uncharacterized phage protein (TIGR01671 family)
MREILFRGKDFSGVINHNWCFGSLDTIEDDRAIIIYSDRFGNKCRIFVDPSTVGEYTGLKDKNGERIFEGDIVKNEWCFINGNSIVRFGEYKSHDSSNDYQCGHLGFYLEHISDFNKRAVRKDIMYFANKCEIIGNVFDNPELLKEG